MTNVNCEPFRDLLPCYALDALDPDESRAVEAHVRSCTDCQAALREYSTVSDGLMFAMPCQPPPPRVRARLIARLASGKPQAASRQGMPLWQWAVGLAMIVLVVVNISR